MFSYAGNHHVSSSAWLWVVGTLVVGAVGLGVLRGLSMRVWTGNGWVLRQGNAITMALWLVSLLVHFVGDSAAEPRRARPGSRAASFLLYLGLTLGVQYYVVLPPGPAAVGAARARRRAGRCGCSSPRGRAPSSPPSAPEARRPARMGTRHGRGAPPDADDPNVIDAEVVEDDDDHGPPELHAPR